MSLYNCLICNYSTKRKNNYSQHILTQKHTINFDKYLKNDETLKSPHFSSLPKNKKQESPHFSSLSKNASSLFPHFEKSHPHFFLTVEEIKAHLLLTNSTPSSLIENENENLFPTFSTVHQASLAAKNSKNHSKKLGNNKYYCDKCEYSTSRSDNFKRHQASCKKECYLQISMIEKNPDTNELLQARIEHLETQRRAEQEHYRSILAEKERYIVSLKENNQHISQTHFNIIQNNIITMNPIKFLNTYCTNNPSLSEVVSSIYEGDVDKTRLSLLEHAIEEQNFTMIGDIMHRILQDKNLELIKRTGKLLGTCENVLFVNDGSGRRFITKGEPGWDYTSDDAPLDNVTRAVIKKINNLEPDKAKFVGKKDRETITKQIKKRNDWSSHKDKIIGTIMGDNLSIEYAIKQEYKKEIEAPPSSSVIILSDGIEDKYI
jgi:hypothetical protein